MTSSEQFLANVLTNALSDIMPYICVAILGLRALAYLRSNFLLARTVVATDGTLVRVNETTSSQSGGLCLLDLMAVASFYFGAALNSDSRLSGVLLGVLTSAFMVLSFLLAIHNFRIAMSTVKDEASIIGYQHREDVLAVNIFTGALAVAFMF